MNASSIASAVSSSTKTLTRLMAAIAAISLVVGGIGVTNVMLVTVRERTREIGVRRAVGARRRDIVVQFLVYAVVISVIGGILGLGVGIGAAYIGGSALSVSPVFSAATVASPWSWPPPWASSPAPARPCRPPRSSPPPRCATNEATIEPTA